MTARAGQPPKAASFITRNPEGAALAVMLAGVLQLGAMPPHLRSPAVTAAATPQIAAVPAMPMAPSPLDPVAAESDRAFAINAAMPVSLLPNPQAAPFALGSGDAASHARARDCLTAAIYYEAATESDAGQAAVAQVVLNRVRDPAYPKSVCAVVFDACQFSFVCDGAMVRVPTAAGWERARRAADSALGGAVAPAVGLATHYHTLWVAPPWAPTLLKTAVIGAHIFYRPPARAASLRYAGIEPEIAQMAPLSSVPMALPASAALAASSPTDAPAAETLAVVMPGI